MIISLMSHITWIGAILILLAFIWLRYFLVYLFNSKKPQVGKYFMVMFKSFNQSKLRVFWRYILFTIEYILGLIVGAFIYSAYYPAKFIRMVVKFIFITKDEFDKYKDK